MKDPNNKGFFILLEGPDGTGKTTLGNNLTEYLRGAGVPVSSYKDPGSTDLGVRLRSMLKGEDDGQKITLKASITKPLLFTAVRAELTQKIREDLAAGMVVICDRYFLSTLVYQCAHGKLSEPHTELIRTLAHDVEVVQAPDTIISLVPISMETARLTHARAFNPDGHKDAFDGMPFDDYWAICKSYADETDNCTRNGAYALLVDDLLSGPLQLFMNVVKRLEQGPFGAWFVKTKNANK